MHPYLSRAFQQYQECDKRHYCSPSSFLIPTPLPIVAWKELKKIGRLWHPEIFFEKNGTCRLFGQWPIVVSYVVQQWGLCKSLLNLLNLLRFFLQNEFCLQKTQIWVHKDKYHLWSLEGDVHYLLLNRTKESMVSSYSPHISSPEHDKYNYQCLLYYILNFASKEWNIWR